MLPTTTSSEVVDRYPRQLLLHDGTELTLTPMVPCDWPYVADFLKATPNDDRDFFRHDMPDSTRVERWCSELDYQHVAPLMAWHQDRIAADGTLEREPGLWTAHIGKLRLLVHPDFRGRGLGRAMIRELVDLGRQLHLHKLVYECAPSQTGLLALLAREGFQQVARLPEFIRGRDAQLHDLIMMVC